MTRYFDITEILKSVWDDGSPDFTDEAQRGEDSRSHSHTGVEPRLEPGALSPKLVALPL